MANLHDKLPVVIVIRDPDSENDYITFAGKGEPLILSIDLGSQFDGNPEDIEQYEEWSLGMLQGYEESGLSKLHPAWQPYVEAIALCDPAGAFPNVKPAIKRLLARFENQPVAS